MALVSKDGVTFIEIGDSPEELTIAQEKGYKVYADVARGTQSFTIPYEELPAAQAKGYKMKAPGSPAQGAAQYKDEGHPDVGALDRAKAQNVLNTGQAKVDYLRQQPDYKDFEFQLDDADKEKVYLRKRGEQDFHTLSPSFSPFSKPLETLKDLPQTLLDNSFDIAASVPIGAATALGALGGGTVGNVPGAVIGAAGAGGAASGLAETVRQKLGNALLPSQDIDTDEIRNAAIGGAILGPVAELGPGLAKKAVKKIAPTIGSLLSGVDKTVLKTVQSPEKMALIDQFQNPQKKLEYIQAVKEATEQAMYGSKNASGVAVEEAVNAAVGIPIPKARGAQPLQQYRAKVMQEADGPARDQKLAAVEDVLEKFFSNPERAKAKAVEANYRKGVQAFDRETSQYEREVQQYVEKKSKELFDSSYQFTGRQVSDAEKRAFEAEIRSQLPAPQPQGRPDTTQAVLAGEFLEPFQAWKRSQDLLNQARNHKQYVLPSGASVHDKYLNTAIKEAGQALQQELGVRTAGDFLKRNKEHSRVAQDLAFVRKYFNQEESTIGQKLGALGNEAQAPSYAKMQQIDNIYGTNIVDSAKTLQASKFLTNPELFPISNKGVTSTSRSLMAALGGMGSAAAAGSVFGPAGALTAAGISLMQSPAAQKLAIKAGKGVADSPLKHLTKPEVLRSLLFGGGAAPSVGAGASQLLGLDTWNRLKGASE